MTCWTLFFGVQQFYTCAHSVALHAHRTVSPEQNDSHPETGTLLHVIWED